MPSHLTDMYIEAPAHIVLLFFSMMSSFFLSFPSVEQPVEEVASFFFSLFLFFS